jgi:hypothetical protein
MLEYTIEKVRMSYMVSLARSFFALPGEEEQIKDVACHRGHALFTAEERAER